MPTPWQQDLEQARMNLTEWLRTKIPDAKGLQLSEVTAPGASGFSNETLFFDATYQRDGDQHHERLVVRVQPTGFAVYPEYDMAKQFRILERLALTDVPVPRVHWLETQDTRVLGSAFFVMDHVDGRVPSDHPSYNAEGWMTRLSNEDVETIWWAGIDCLARVASVDPEAQGLDFLARPELGDSPLDQNLAYYKNYLDWAARGLEQPVPEAGYEWLIKNKPQGDTANLVWGDARIGNIIWDGTRPGAVVDWESAMLGNPEMDLGWTLFLDRYHSDGLGNRRLPGFPDRKQTIARYEDLTGRRVQHLHYYEVFAGFRFACSMIRIAQQLTYYEMMDEGSSRTFEIDNPVTRLLSDLLDMPLLGSD